MGQLMQLKLTLTNVKVLLSQGLRHSKGMERAFQMTFERGWKVAEADTERPFEMTVIVVNITAESGKIVG